MVVIEAAIEEGFSIAAGYRFRLAANHQQQQAAVPNEFSKRVIKAVEPLREDSAASLPAILA